MSDINDNARKIKELNEGFTSGNLIQKQLKENNKMKKNLISKKDKGLTSGDVIKKSK